MDIRDILYWIFLVISLILLAWILFGNSPSEIMFVVTLFVTMFLKIWRISDRQIRTDNKIDRFGDSLRRLADDFRDFKDEFKDLKNHIKK
tara:strand:+ start:15 stop:284 length:270 start_codon:yes stop_codon:yes gene_type:complete